MPLVINDIEPKDREDIKRVFLGLVNTVKNNPGLYKEAKKYNAYCIKKYKKIMDSTMKTILCDLIEHGLEPIVQSSYSANVYIDDSVDLDIVVPYETEEDKERVINVIKQLGYEYLESRNTDLEHMTHVVYTKKYSIFELELKVRRWSTYKEHLYKIHKFLDALDADTRMIWRYIRSEVLRNDIQIQKKVKYLWYMYGAVETGVSIDKEYFPMNIYSSL